MKTLSIRVGLVTSVLLMALLFAAFPAQNARAATVAEMQAQIQALIVQLTQLQQRLAAMKAASCPTFTTDLWIGNRGAEVTKLQTYLIARGHAIPAGATGYFGEQTRAALMSFQAAQGISPSGIFAAPTRAKIQSLCVVQVPAVPTGPSTPTTPTTPAISTLRGEASFERFVAKDGNDSDLEEGDDNAEVLEVSFRVRGGDALVDRLEIGVEPDAGNDEDEPWDTFERFRVVFDGDEIGSIDASRENNWREDDPANGQYTIRLSDIDFVVKRGEEVELTVEAELQSSVRGTEDGEIWNIFIPDEGIRGIDADNVAIYTGDTADATSLNIDQEGSSDELIVRRSDEDPDAGTLRLDDDRNSDWLEVFVFDLDTDDSRNDIEVRQIPIMITIENSSSSLTDLVRNARLTVQGKTYTDESIVDGTPGTITFDIDRHDLAIDAGDRVEAVLELEFHSLAAADEGARITASVRASDIDAEGADDLSGSQLAGVASSETHTLITRGSEIAPDTATAVITTLDGPSNDYVTFTINVDVTAFNQDVYIPIAASSADYEVTDNLGNVLAGTKTAVLDASAEERGSYFFIPEGETERLSLTVTYQPGFTTPARLQLEAINYAASETAPDQTWNAIPASKYRTPVRTIVN